MILRCPRCNGQHLEYTVADPQFRVCVDCGAYSVVEDDRWQVEPLAYDPRWLEPERQAV